MDELQCGPIIILFLGSIGMDNVISELCYGGEILQRNYRKMTILYGHFHTISFVKLHVKNIWSHNKTVLNPNPCYNEVCYRRTALN